MHVCAPLVLLVFCLDPCNPLHSHSTNISNLEVLSRNQPIAGLVFQFRRILSAMHESCSARCTVSIPQIAARVLLIPRPIPACFKLVTRKVGTRNASANQSTAPCTDYDYQLCTFCAPKVSIDSRQVRGKWKYFKFVQKKRATSVRQ
jgi:hypothetical protein